MDSYGSVLAFELQKTSYHINIFVFLVYFFSIHGPAYCRQKNPQDAAIYEKQDAWSQSVLAARLCILAYSLLPNFAPT